MPNTSSQIQGDVYKLLVLFNQLSKIKKILDLQLYKTQASSKTSHLSMEPVKVEHFC